MKKYILHNKPSPVRGCYKPSPVRGCYKPSPVRGCLTRKQPDFSTNGKIGKHIDNIFRKLEEEMSLQPAKLTHIKNGERREPLSEHQIKLAPSIPSNNRLLCKKHQQFPITREEKFSQTNYVKTESDGKQPSIIGFLKDIHKTSRKPFMKRYIGAKGALSNQTWLLSKCAVRKEVQQFYIND